MSRNNRYAPLTENTAQNWTVSLSKTRRVWKNPVSVIRAVRAVEIAGCLNPLSVKNFNNY